MRKDVEMMTEKLTKFVGAAAVAAVVLGGMQAQGAYLLEYHDGESNPFASWTNVDINDDTPGSGAGTLTQNAAVGSPSSTGLEITANTDGSIYRDVIYTTSAALNGSTGNLSTWGGNNDQQIVGMQFDFYNDATDAPTGLGFYFADEGGHVWYYDIDPSFITDGWNTYGVTFSYNYSVYGSSGWYGYTDNTWTGLLDGTDFATDISTDGAVDRLGVWLAYETLNNDQTYGIDNFGLTIPEPETYLVLGMALLSIAVVFRKRISDSLAEARTMMHA